MKKGFYIIYILIYIISILVLFFISERSVDSMVVILPALLIVSAVTVVLQNKSILKTATSLIPFVSSFLFSFVYIILEFRIYDPLLKDLYPFSNVVYDQIDSICVGVILSMIIFIIRLINANLKRKS